MFIKRLSATLYFLLVCTFISMGQIEVANAAVKDFRETGFGGFLNFSLPVSEAGYVTIEGGLQYFKDKETDEDLALVPMLLGYRYTLNKSGTGFYVEPNAGYCYGISSIIKYNEAGSPIAGNDGKPAVEKVSGPMAGVGVGYLFEPGGSIQFNLGLRYERTFGNAGVNIFAFRVSHTFSLGKKDSY